MTRQGPDKLRPASTPRAGAGPFLRWLAAHMAIGIAVGWGMLGALFALNFHGLRDLVFGSPDWPIALVLLGVFFAITFGSLGMGFGVMMQPREKDGLGD
ncbi:MAG: hypothetical protein PVI23_01235 [Maricaulaceae bacterium]|jgi:hypothetical protein